MAGCAIGIRENCYHCRASFNKHHLELIDLPGTYSLAARSLDEMVAVDLLMGQCPGEKKPDVIVAIVDASNLERHLYLTTQLLDLGSPVVLALNMIDVARKHGIRIDVERLRKQLGVPIVPIQANRGIGLDQLKQTIVESIGGPTPARRPVFPESFEREVAALAAPKNKDKHPCLSQRAAIKKDVAALALARKNKRQRFATKRR